MSKLLLMTMLTAAMVPHMPRTERNPDWELNLQPPKNKERRAKNRRAKQSRQKNRR